MGGSRALAVLSMHTSPLAQPGTGDGGGMNVYVRELCSALARSGTRCEVFTRSWSAELPAVVEVEPGLRVHHVTAGPRRVLDKGDLIDHVEEFAEAVLDRLDASEVDGPEAVHANYWLSGMAGHVIKHRLDVPLVCTFHTLARVKAHSDAGEGDSDIFRAEAEAEVMACSDAVLASNPFEAEDIVGHYGPLGERVVVIPPGVDHAFFSPGDRAQARRAVGLPGGGPLLMFLGRLQPLKAADVAVRALAELTDRHPGANLAVVGGPSGPDGAATVDKLLGLVDELGVADRVHFIPPVAHELVSTFCRAADVCLVPSRSESFGLVALEAAACGTPVVASAVGGLRSLVVDGVTGALVERRDPAAFASAVDRILSDAATAGSMGRAAARHARGYSWRRAAASLVELMSSLASGRLVQCS
ncbi:MAG TPA: glycosyltransferase [Acidimicrobiales bacterium]|nr:glycosyltransferase [Acidimicrobiales bacterium]